MTELPTITQVPSDGTALVLFRADHGAAQHLGSYRQSVLYDRDRLAFTCSPELWPKLMRDMTAHNVVVVELVAPKRTGPPRWKPEPANPAQLAINARGVELCRAALAGPQLAPDDPWSWQP